VHILQFNGRTAEFVDFEVQCVDGAGSFTQNFPVHLAVDGNTANGIAATHPAAISHKSLAGTMRSNVAINSYGLARAWGYQASNILSNYGSSVTITAGDALRAAAGTGLGYSSTAAALTILNTKYAIALATTSNTNSTLGALSASGAWVQTIQRAL